MPLRSTDGFLPQFLKDSAQEEPTSEFEDSFVPPCSFWTGWEKVRFFTALKRYSRLQPELIQQEIGDTKQIWEVCTYINYLDQACASQASTSKAVEHEYAREMTDKWVSLEERWALLRTDDEYELLTSFYERQQESSDDPGLWKTREAMRDLDLPRLVALDNLLRDKSGTTDSDEVSESQNDGIPEPSSPPARSDPPEVNLSSLTPQERRRYQKRFHMRKKRAEERGEDPDEGVELQKIGRPAKGFRAVPPKKHSKRGLVLREKSRVFFERAGITRGDLTKEDLDIFHLSAYGKLAELTCELSGNPDYGDSLCGEVLLLLRAHLLHFLREIMRRVILFMNQERVRTEHTKIFKGTRDKVRAEHIRHVSRMMIGEADQSEKLFQLEEQIRRFKPSARPDADDSDSSSAEFTDSESESSDSWDDSQSESGEERRAYTNTKEEMKTACSRLRPPFLWVPHCIATHPSNHPEYDLVFNEPWNEDLEEELLEQLDEEEEIHQTQENLDKDDEKELWTKVRAAREQEVTTLAAVALQEKLKRKRKGHTDESGKVSKPKKRRVPNPESGPKYRKIGGRITSKIYIDDDDDI